MDNRNSPNLQANTRNFIFPVVAVLLTALAAGTGWGIRGQFGHETGAMIAGALASLTLVMLFVPQATSLAGARAAAMMTVALGVGGSMTYGQTIGLTHDQELHGHWEAFRWGMAGLFMKGSIWIGFGGVFLGMGLGGKRYSVLEILALVLGMVGMMFLGISLINSPFEPTTNIPTRNSETPKIRASAAAPLTKRSAPQIRPTKPRATASEGINRGMPR